MRCILMDRISPYRSFPACIHSKATPSLSTYCIHGVVCHILYLVYSLSLLLDVEMIVHLLKLLKGAQQY